MLKEGKTNWKYILIVVVVGFIVSVGILRWVVKQEIPLTELPEMKKSEKVEDETADWETYRNEEYGFEMGYPKNIEIEEKLIFRELGVLFSLYMKFPYKSEIALLIESGKGKDLEEFIREKYEKCVPAYEQPCVEYDPQRIKSFQLGNVSGLKENHIYYLKRNDLVYSFWNLVFQNEEDFIILGEMLSTFKFIE